MRPRNPLREREEKKLDLLMAGVEFYAMIRYYMGVHTIVEGNTKKRRRNLFIRY